MFHGNQKLHRERENAIVKNRKEFFFLPIDQNDHIWHKRHPRLSY